MENLLMGQLNVELATTSNMGKQGLIDLLEIAVDSRIILTKPDGTKVELEIGCFLGSDVKIYDLETGIEVVDQSEAAI